MTHHPTDAPQFFLTAPTNCPYLPGRQERKVFTHLIGERASAMNHILSQGGFRRSQNIAYRPACETCRACMSVRVRVDEFRPDKSMRRNLAANSTLMGAELPPMATGEQYSLFRDYLESRHADGGMIDMSVLDYTMMVEDTHVETMVIEYRRRGPDSFLSGMGEGPLIGMVLTDVLNDGLSMVYSFYDPTQSSLGLGTFMILDHIERARRRGFPYLYLGYWVNGSRKMDYKRRFQPLEYLLPHGWEQLDEPPEAD
ncbi:arginyltransferase [Oryzibacter oryziterrae]|uniref:arginyltransferase n=1 Tax=Oryzibacter oryziterrae TaxID=2766474 RepID=UPI001F02273E|nr:arginyltransferase [Oryzibacter oryziterrae]